MGSLVLRRCLVVFIITAVGVYLLYQHLPIDAAHKPLPVMSAKVVLAERGYQGFRSDYLSPVELVPSDSCVGVFSPNLCVSLRNTTKDRAIALRGVYWTNYRKDGRLWLHKVYGPAAEDKSGKVIHNTLNQASSGLLFEEGLILPGEETLVSAPLTPQRDGKHELAVRYVTVAEGKGWMRDILLQSGHENSLRDDIYSPATPALISSRKGHGGLGLARTTMKHDAKPLAEQVVKFTLQIPVKDDPSASLTGGLSAEDAAVKAGIDVLKSGCLAFYSKALESWFFVSPDRRAAAMRKQNGKWVKVDIPDMDQSAPEEFVKFKDAGTPIVLRPDTFKDILKVDTPHYAGPGYYQVGHTNVPPDKLWKVLERARQKKLDMHLVTYNPYGLGNETRLTCGVTLDKEGKWIEPKMKIGYR